MCNKLNQKNVMTAPTPTGSLPPDFDKVLAPTPTLTLPPLAAVDRYLPYPLELEEKIRKSLRKGQVAFNVPERMSVGDTEEIEVKVTQNLDKKLNIQVKKGQKIERKTIDIYHNMKAELTGAGFNIKPLQEDDTFLVLEENVAAWSWAITPNKTGKQKLHLKINAKLKLDDSEITYNLQSLKRTIEVQFRRQKEGGRRQKGLTLKNVRLK